jgi:hypothetical protein
LHCGGVPNKCGNVKTVVPEEFWFGSCTTSPAVTNKDSDFRTGASQMWCVAAAVQFTCTSPIQLLSL